MQDAYRDRRGNAGGLGGEVTGNNIDDVPILLELLDQIPSDEEIGSVTADGAYDTQKCHEAIAARGAAAVIRPARTPNSGNRQALAPSPETKLYALRSTWAEQSGDGGVATTAEAVSRPK